MAGVRVYELVSLICLTAAFLQHTDAETVVLTGDNIVTGVCTAGGAQDLTSQLKNAKAVPKIDYLGISNDVDCVNIQARNLRGWAGIAAYMKYTTAVHWRCSWLKYLKTKGKTCCGMSASDPDWTRRRVGGVYRYNINKKHKKRYDFRLHYRVKFWRWSKKIKWRNACCQMCKCGPFCKSCTKAGVGKCDDGACHLGPATGDCKAKCTVQIKTSGASSPDKTGYIKVTHPILGFTTTYNANDGDGAYAYKLDIGTCTLYDKFYHATPATVTQEVNQWGSDSANTNVIVFVFDVGTQQGPYTKIFRLTGSAAVEEVSQPVVQYYTNRCIEGVPGQPLTVETDLANTACITTVI